jgi:hypothetical protein
LRYGSINREFFFNWAEKEIFKMLEDYTEEGKEGGNKPMRQGEVSRGRRERVWYRRERESERS